MSGKGRLETVTNGRFQVSDFNDSFPAMNLKSRQSPSDPLQTPVLWALLAVVEYITVVQGNIRA